MPNLRKRIEGQTIIGKPSIANQLEPTGIASKEQTPQMHQANQAASQLNLTALQPFGPQAVMATTDYLISIFQYLQFLQYQLTLCKVTPEVVKLPFLLDGCKGALSQLDYAKSHLIKEIEMRKFLT
jgi:hypothetical protein